MKHRRQNLFLKDISFFVPLILAKAFKIESDFETSIFRYGIVKILVNPLGFTVFFPRIPKNPLFTKFYDLKGAEFLCGFW